MAPWDITLPLILCHSNLSQSSAAEELIQLGSSWRVLASLFQQLFTMATTLGLLTQPWQHQTWLTWICNSCANTCIARDRGVADSSNADSSSSINLLDCS